MTTMMSRASSDSSLGDQESTVSSRSSTRRKSLNDRVESAEFSDMPSLSSFRADEMSAGASLTSRTNNSQVSDGDMSLPSLCSFRMEDVSMSSSYHSIISATTLQNGEEANENWNSFSTGNVSADTVATVSDDDEFASSKEGGGKSPGTKREEKSPEQDQQSSDSRANGRNSDILNQSLQPQATSHEALPLKSSLKQSSSKTSLASVDTQEFERIEPEDCINNAKPPIRKKSSGSAPAVGVGSGVPRTAVERTESFPLSMLAESKAKDRSGSSSTIKTGTVTEGSSSSLLKGGDCLPRLPKRFSGARRQDREVDSRSSGGDTTSQSSDDMSEFSGADISLDSGADISIATDDENDSVNEKTKPLSFDADAADDEIDSVGEKNKPLAVEAIATEDGKNDSVNEENQPVSVESIATDDKIDSVDDQTKALSIETIAKDDENDAVNAKHQPLSVDDVATTDDEIDSVSEKNQPLSVEAVEVDDENDSVSGETKPLSAEVKEAITISEDLTKPVETATKKTSRTSPRKSRSKRRSKSSSIPREDPPGFVPETNADHVEISKKSSRNGKKKKDKKRNGLSRSKSSEMSSKRMNSYVKIEPPAGATERLKIRSSSLVGREAKETPQLDEGPRPVRKDIQSEESGTSATETDVEDHEEAAKKETPIIQTETQAKPRSGSPEKDPRRVKLVKRMSSSLQKIGRQVSFSGSFRKKIGRTASKLAQIGRKEGQPANNLQPTNLKPARRVKKSDTSSAA